MNPNSLKIERVEFDFEPELESANDVAIDGGLWKWRDGLEPPIRAGSLRRQCFHNRLPRAPCCTEIPDWRRTL